MQLFEQWRDSVGIDDTNIEQQSKVRYSVMEIFVLLYTYYYFHIFPACRGLNG